MTLASVLTGLAIYAGCLAVLLACYWVYGVFADRRHARRMMEAFDRYVARLDSRRGESDRA